MAIRGPLGVFANTPDPINDPIRRTGRSGLAQRDPWQGLRNTIGNVSNAPSGASGGQRLGGKTFASDGPFSKIGWIAKMLTSGNPATADIEAQQFGGAQSAAAKFIQTQIANGVPPQKAVLDFMQTPEGQDFFSSGGDLQKLAGIGKLASPDPDAAQAQNRAEKLAALPADDAGPSRLSDYLDVAADLFAEGDDEGARIALSMAEEARQEATWYDAIKSRTTTENFTQSTGLRKEIQTLPSYKNFTAAAPIFDTMVDASGRDTKAADLNLVYGLGKIFDPNSVVREGEMVMVKDTSALPDWLVGTINSLNGGARLQPDTRNAILAEAQSRIGSYRKLLDTDISQYTRLAEEYGLDPELVIPFMPQLRELPAKQPTTGKGDRLQPGADVRSMTDDELRRIINGQ